MFDKFQEVKLKIALFEIIRGFTVIDVGRHKSIYVKHFTFIDTASIDLKYAEAYKFAIGKGLPLIDEQIKTAIGNNTWTEKQEKRYSEIPAEINTLKLTKSKLFLKRELDSINSEIETLEKELLRLEYERSEVVGYTAEIFATKKANEHAIYYSFRGKNLDTFYFSEEEYETFSNEEISNLIVGHAGYVAKFTPKEMKRIAISTAFMNMIYLAGEDIMSFFGKPVLELTNRQMEVYNLGRYFKNLMAEYKGTITDDLLADPDKFIEAAENTKTAQNFADKLDNKESSGTAIVGATKEDIEKLGLTKEAGTISLADEASKKGGSLSMEELMKLHGY
jgi:hypothetical protein